MSIAMEPLAEKADSLSTASFALTLKYHVLSSVSSVVWVKVAVAAVEELTFAAKEESVDHSTMYASVE